MTTDDERTMTDHAHALADELSATVERLSRLEALGDRAERAAEQAADELAERTYGMTVLTTVHVELYGGGPAGGVEFTFLGKPSWDSLQSARAWHQDWFQPKGYWDLGDEVAGRLFDRWGVEYAS